MSGYRDDDQRNQDEFSLEAILAEFGSGMPQRQEEAPAAGQPVPEGTASGEEPPRDELAEQDWFPTRPRSHKEPLAEEKTPEEAGTSAVGRGQAPAMPEGSPSQTRGKVTVVPKPSPRIVREEAPPPLPPNRNSRLNRRRRYWNFPLRSRTIRWRLRSTI